MLGMNLKDQIVASAERAFDREGFTATGMDQLAAAAHVSSRTLYKHVVSKAELITEVLEARARRFFKQCIGNSVDAVFADLETWANVEGARGCLFLRAVGETGGESRSISDAATAYRKRLREMIAVAVANDLDDKSSAIVIEQILVLFEGAVSAATYRGTGAISAARAAAAVLLDNARLQLSF
jgi:AcrR family transcriptional regulator